MEAIKDMENYVTIWVEVMDGHWSVERTHTKDYAMNMLGVTSVGEKAVFNGKNYAYFPEGVNPNDLTE